MNRSLTKTLNKLFLVICLTALTTTISCSKNKKESTNTELSKVSETKQLEVAIEGMTCEIGCAKLIASKTGKLDGVSDAKVDFENKTGYITYDASIISKNQIIESINNIAGGDTYKITSSKDIN